MQRAFGKPLVLVSLLALLAYLVEVRLPHAFDYSKTIIDTAEIVSGGPEKDGIPSLSMPDFIPASKADYLRESDHVIGVTLGGVAKAYPVKILSWHEAVNDATGPIKFLVTW